MDTVKCNTALRKIANFCNVYKQEDIEDLSSRLLVAVVGQNYSNYTKGNQQCLLDYFEAIEEVLPAVHDLHDQLASLSKTIPENASYEEKIKYRLLFTSLKDES